MASGLRVVIAAGYGGHAGYAIALAQSLNRLGLRPTLIVPRGFDYIRKRLEPYGDVLEATLPRRAAEPMIRTLHRWPLAFAESFAVCSRGFDVVVLTGSNFSIPPAVVCKLFGAAKLYAVEAVDRISTPSKAVKLLTKIGAEAVLHWEEQLKIHPRGLVVGPIYEHPVYQPRNEGYVFVTTGTLGFKELFDSVFEAFPGRRIVIQTGDVDPEVYRSKGVEAFSYTEDIHRWIAGAELVITHFPGMTAVTARLAYGKPVVMVYNPRAKLSSPKSDGYVLAEKLNAVYIESPSRKNLINAYEKAMKLEVPKYPNGADTLANIIVANRRTL